MSCVLCFTSINSKQKISIRNRRDRSVVTAIELIEKYFAFSAKILSEDVIKSDETCLCKNCWSSLETFNDFHTFVAANYNSTSTEPIEEKFMITNELNSSELIVYDKEVGMEELEHIIKVEVFEDEAVIQVESPKAMKLSVPSPPPKKAKVPLRPPLDAADDQTIRETANMNCEICHKLLDSLREAKSHFRTEHGVKGFIMCCGRKFTERYVLVEHVKTHYSITYACTICTKTFNMKKYLKQHQTVHDKIKQFECAHCPKTFSKKFQVRNHLLSVHIFDNIAPTFECVVENCGKKFLNPARLKYHVNYTHMPNNKICEICSKSSRTKDGLDRHMKTHRKTPEDRIRCEICGHFSTDLRSYKRHVKNHGTEQLDNICSYCGKKSPNANALKSHIRFVHEMTKRLQCRFCEKNFRRPRELTDHEAAIHTLEEPYSCSFCPKTFRNQANMLKHRKNMHPNQYQKPKYKT